MDDISSLNMIDLSDSSIHLSDIDLLTTQNNMTPIKLSQLNNEENKEPRTPLLRNDQFSDIDIPSQILISDINSTPRFNANQEVHTPMPALHYTSHKAGMDGVDQSLINNKIYELSK